MEEPKPGIYYHFKHPELHYEVLGVALHIETEEKMVVYQRTFDDHQIFVRPLAMFMEEVDKPELNYKGLRFVYVSP
ncbi:MAG: hypothetical protein JWM39_405 [Parcubacteria group bacterium]|nr:hypothetical protein [Parcubacteria group bacterium]